MSPTDDRRLRGRIKVLVDNGYFSKLQWADNVPWFGTITEKGYDYFHDKEVFVRAKLKKQPNFKLLDKESEIILSEFINSNEDRIVVHKDSKEARVLEHLEEQGYISFEDDRRSRKPDGSFIGAIYVTQSGKNYFSDKEDLIEEILLTESDAPMPADAATPHKTRKTASKTARRSVPDSSRLIFSGLLGFDCGVVETYIPVRTNNCKTKDSLCMTEFLRLEDLQRYLTSRKPPKQSTRSISVKRIKSMLTK